VPATGPNNFMELADSRSGVLQDCGMPQVQIAMRAADVINFAERFEFRFVANDSYARL